ncbi:MAG: hypothetical protein DRI57_02555 [Deltaproteobacteria bacterium]|nr:MAG: hypothetical protein DRI57_02555 [Deltaproteobacteria bacterium]
MKELAQSVFDELFSTDYEAFHEEFGRYREGDIAHSLLELGAVEEKERRFDYAQSLSPKFYEAGHDPMHLKSVNVAELFVKVNEIPDDPAKIVHQEMNIFHAHSGYDQERRTIRVGLLLESGMEKERKTAYSMRIELFGEFEADESGLQKQHIESWAGRSAPFILCPFLREHAFALTVRCGLSPAILPLMQLPALRERE